MYASAFASLSYRTNAALMFDTLCARLGSAITMTARAVRQHRAGRLTRSLSKRCWPGESEGGCPEQKGERSSLKSNSGRRDIPKSKVLKLDVTFGVVDTNSTVTFHAEADRGDTVVLRWLTMCGNRDMGELNATTVEEILEKRKAREGESVGGGQRETGMQPHRGRVRLSPAGLLSHTTPAHTQ